jgi:DNA polymerase-3 subunit beta
MVIGFNSQYLLDFLKVVGATSAGVRLELKDSQSAGQLRPDDAGDEYKYRYIVMPMRI